jgi:hypothetical protein
MKIMNITNAKSKIFKFPNEIWDQIYTYLFTTNIFYLLKLLKKKHIFYEMIKLPNIFWHEIYIFKYEVLQELLKLKELYIFTDNSIIHTFDKRLRIINRYYWIEYVIFFPTIVSCYYFNIGYYNTDDFENYINI